MIPLEIEIAIKEIQERNQRVEVDKAWEISWTRRSVVLICTYVVVVAFFLISQLPHPFLNAIVPVLAFVLSNSTLSLVKRRWLQSHRK